MIRTQRTSAKFPARRWATYAAAGVASVATGGASAEAAITHVVINGGLGQDSAPGNDQYFALANGSALNFFHPAATYGGAVFLGVFNGAVTGSVAGFATSAGSYAYASKLSANVNISTLNFIGSNSGYFPGFATMAWGNGYAGSQFLGAGDSYVAFRFNGQSQYGWARVTMAGSQPDNSFTIQEYAFGDVGEQVSVGQTSAVPEPSSLAMLALGAAGLAKTRRRRAVA